MSLKPEKPRKRDRLLNFFRSRSPSSHLTPPSESPVPGNEGSLSAVSQLPAQLDQPHNHPADLGSCSSPNRPPSPIIVPADRQETSEMAATAMELIKESLRVTARVSHLCAPLKTVAGGLVEIFDRIDAIKGVQIEATRLRDEVDKLANMLKAYQQGQLPPSTRDRLDGLHRALEEKRAALEKKLNRLLAKRIVFSTEDTEFLVQVLREITFAIEVTTFDMTVRSNIEVSKIYSNAILDKLGYSAGAEFNHEDRQGCTHGTRVSLLANLLAWATAEVENSSNVFWLNGMAGTGKTTVMETFCLLLNEKGFLGASFFCSIKSRRDVRFIFPSIAKTLAGKYPRFREILVQVLTTCSDPLGMNLRDQYHTLILHPASAAFNKDEIIVISIDALDECEDQEGIEKLLKAILDSEPNILLRFFVTSRPEWHIRETFRQRQRHYFLRLHDIEEHIVQADISIYLNDSLGRLPKLKQRYGNSWPPPEIGIIVERTGKLFIYASTILKYISNYRGDPCDRLQKMAGLRTPVAVAVEHVEKLYGFIIAEAFTGIDDEEALRIWSCLSVLISTQRPHSVSTYAKLLGTSVDLIRTALGSLHSVIIVPEDDDRHISLYHASFLDYLATRADDMRPAHKENAIRCFRFMNSELRLGISGATTSYQSNDDQPQALFIPDHLKFTCTSWGHLVLQLIGQNNVIVEDIHRTVESFLRSKFLYWLEVLSAMGDVPHAPRLLHRLSQKVSASHSLHLILMDFMKFTSTFLPAIRTCAPHIYLSALPFASSTSMVSKLFLPKFPSLPVVHQSSDNKHVPYPILRFEGHGWIKSVAFSPNGKYIVSGSRDYTIQLWNIETGEAAVKLFEGHKDEVCSVVFSPNGKCIASGSKDHTIRLWNLETGKMTSKPFDGDIVDCATSVSFTSDGGCIISVLQHYTVHLWNIETGEVVLKPLGGQGEAAQANSSCAAISPNGIHIVWASEGNKHIQLGNIETGKTSLKPLYIGSTRARSVSFSPDGKYVVIGGYRTLQLWNVETGEAVLKAIEGHKDFVRSVMFSPDGEYIVSGSNDYTVRIWDIKTGEAASKPLEGHTCTVASVSFSPDGKYIVSGSWDCTIHLWNFDTHKVVLKPFEGHTDSITSVSFPPDVKYLASGSLDHTIRLWNVETGESVLKPLFGNHLSSITISFSPDGEYIASSSWNTTSLWNAKTGELEVAFTPFEGHPQDRPSVSTISFSPDGKHITTGSANSTAVHLWNIKTRETALQSFGNCTGSESKCISFSPSGKYIAAGSPDGTIQLWDVEAEEAAFKPLEMDKYKVKCIAFSADEKYIVACSGSGEFWLWNVKTGEFQEYNTDPIISVAMSSDGKYITFGLYRTIELWTIETDGIRLESELLGGHRRFVNSVSFSLDGKYIASGSDDRTIRIYNNNSAEKIHLDRRAVPATFLHHYPTGSVVTNPVGSPREGWLQYPSGELLLWVPPGLHLGLYLPGVVHVIGADSIKIEVSKFVHGPEWLRCQEDRCEPANDTLT